MMLVHKFGWGWVMSRGFARDKKGLHGQRHSGGRAAIVLVILVGGLLAGCTGANNPSKAAQNADTGTTIAAFAQTPVGTPIATRTLLPQEIDATRIARLQHERQTVEAHETSFALGTPYPTSPPMTPRPTRPAITPVPGINVDCASASREFDFGNGWNEIVDGQYVIVQAGALKPDRLQSALRVYTLTLDLRSAPLMEVYTAPSNAGKVYITSVDWPLMTLTADDAIPPSTFVFNLETRQWVSPTPGPSPSVSVSPIPSVSPLPTQQQP
jgi:hypothetical protein